MAKKNETQKNVVPAAGKEPPAIMLVDCCEPAEILAIAKTRVHGFIMFVWSGQPSPKNPRITDYQSILLKKGINFCPSCGTKLDDKTQLHRWPWKRLGFLTKHLNKEGVYETQKG